MSVAGLRGTRARRGLHVAMVAVALGLVSSGCEATESAHSLAERFAGDAKRAEAMRATEPRKSTPPVPPTQAAQAQPASEPVRGDLERQRQHELDRLSARLERARAAREAKLATARKTGEVTVAARPEAKPVPVQRRPAETAVAPWSTEIATPTPPLSAPRAEIDASARSTLGMGGGEESPLAERVAVLIVMKPGDRGIRRIDKSADPVLCTLDGCYVSAGPAAEATFLPERKVLGIKNTWGARAGACSRSLACVFRGVDLGRRPAYLQPVDLKMLVHDRREGQIVRSDSACRVDRGHLACARAIETNDYVLWVVPERLARAIGGEALQLALADGLGVRRPATWLGPHVTR